MCYVCCDVQQCFVVLYVCIHEMQMCHVFIYQSMYLSLYLSISIHIIIQACLHWSMYVSIAISISLSLYIYVSLCLQHVPVKCMCVVHWELHVLQPPLPMQSHCLTLFIWTPLSSLIIAECIVLICFMLIAYDSVCIYYILYT